MRDNAGWRFRSVIVWGGLGAFEIIVRLPCFQVFHVSKWIIRISIQLLAIFMARPSHPVGGKYIPLDLVPPFSTAGLEIIFG